MLSSKFTWSILISLSKCQLNGAFFNLMPCFSSAKIFALGKMCLRMSLKICMSLIQRRFTIFKFIEVQMDAACQGLSLNVQIFRYSQMSSSCFPDHTSPEIILIVLYCKLPSVLRHLLALSAINFSLFVYYLICFKSWFFKWISNEKWAKAFLLRA